METQTKAKKIFAIVGMPGTGKSSVVKILVSHYNLPYIHFGNITMEEVRKQGLAETQENEKKIRHQLRETYGMSAYAQMSLPKIEEMLQKNSSIIIDGLYSWSEYAFLRKSVEAEIVMVSIISRRKTRYSRLAARPERALSRQEAEERDFAEIEHLEKGGPIALCDYYITNDSTVEELEKAIHSLAAELGLLRKDGE